MTKRMPDPAAIFTAIMWLRANDCKACAAVADWLQHENRERYLRNLARESGITVTRLRRMYTLTGT